MAIVRWGRLWKFPVYLSNLHTPCSREQKYVFPIIIVFPAPEDSWHGSSVNTCWINHCKCASSAVKYHYIEFCLLLIGLIYGGPPCAFFAVPWIVGLPVQPRAPRGAEILPSVRLALYPHSFRNVWGMNRWVNSWECLSGLLEIIS